MKKLLGIIFSSLFYVNFALADLDLSKVRKKYKIDNKILAITNNGFLDEVYLCNSSNENCKLINKHFAPQYVWLMHLQKFHKGTVTLYPFKDIKKFTKKHTHKWSTLSATEKEPVAQIEEFVDKDFLLLKYLNKTLTIKELLKNVLS